MTKEYQITLECSVFLIVDMEVEDQMSDKELMEHAKGFCFHHLKECRNVNDVQSIGVVDYTPIIRSEE